MLSQKIKKEVLSTIKPTKKEHLLLTLSVDEFLSKLKDSAKELGIISSFLVGGSFGKNTYLKNSFDVDIFCRFDLSYEDSELSNLAKKILTHANITFVKQKGSRDYYSGNFNEIHFEVVPNYLISSLEDAKNSTDYSPMHVEYVRKESHKNKNLLDEIRLTKQFLKANKLYGAESYINGFSGHIIDLLIIYYGSLNSFLEDITHWSETKIIDVANHYSKAKNILHEIPESKVSNLIVVDSILKNRNAARALGSQKYFELLSLVHFKNSFDEKDFIINEELSKNFIKRKKHFSKTNNVTLMIYTLTLNTIESQDISGSKLLKLFSKVRTYYTDLDFSLFEEEFFISFDENVCIFSYCFTKEELPKNKIMKGPQLYMHDAVTQFSKNKKIFFVEEDRIFSYEKRKIISLDDCKSLQLKDLKKIFSKDLSFIKNVVFNIN